MDSLERWFDPNIPMEYIIISFSVLCVVMAIGFIVYRGQRMTKFVMGALAIEYYFLVLCSTVICRTSPVSKRVELMPFYNYSDIWNGVDFKRTVMEILLNIALFVPIGFLLGGIMSKGFLKVLFTGCLLSILIELLQLASGMGLCETNDVIHNTIGSMLGYAAAMVLKKLISSECNILIRYKRAYMNS